MTYFSENRSQSEWMAARRAAVLCLNVLAVFAGAALAAPFVPNDPAQILERLPPRDGVAWDAIRTLHAALEASPDDASVAAELSQRYLDLNRVAGDPRLVAYATPRHRALGRSSCSACRRRARACADRADRAPLRRGARRALAVGRARAARCAGVVDAGEHRYGARSLRGREARLQSARLAARRHRCGRLLRRRAGHDGRGGAGVSLPHERAWSDPNPSSRD